MYWHHDIANPATGTGIWAIEMGDLHPGARVIGTDVGRRAECLGRC